MFLYPTFGDKTLDERVDPKKIILVDTVGFIRRLPEDLLAAFRATLEELEDASLFIHVVDGASPRYPEHIKTVQDILSDLKLSQIPQILVMNKIDQINQNEVNRFVREYNGLAICALTGQGIQELRRELYIRLFGL
jgi:GTP-binding protein HflX